jgi:hypothetical protein
MNYFFLLLVGLDGKKISVEKFALTGAEKRTVAL